MKGQAMSEEWNDDQVAELRTMFEKRLTAGTIAERTGRTRNAVIGKLGRLGLHANKNRPAGIKFGIARDARADRIRARKAAAELPPPVPVERFINRPAPGYRGKPMIELEPGECRYPIGEPVLLFCGAPVAADGLSWCADHRRLCFQPARPAPTYQASGQPAPALTAAALRALL